MCVRESKDRRPMAMNVAEHASSHARVQECAWYLCLQQTLFRVLCLDQSRTQCVSVDGHRAGFQHPASWEGACVLLARFACGSKAPCLLLLLGPDKAKSCRLKLNACAGLLCPKQGEGGKRTRRWTWTAALTPHHALSMPRQY